MSDIKVLRVLLVEDNDSQAFLIQKALERAASHNGCDYDVIVKKDGVEALDFLERELATGGALPHYILLDLFLPRMNGLEFLDAIKIIKTLRRIPVVMLTTSESEVNDAYDNGVATYMVKPVGALALAQELHKIGVLMSSDYVRLPA